MLLYTVTLESLSTYTCTCLNTKKSINANALTYMTCYFFNQTGSLVSFFLNSWSVCLSHVRFNNFHMQRYDHFTRTNLEDEWKDNGVFFHFPEIMM